MRAAEAFIDATCLCFSSSEPLIENQAGKRRRTRKFAAADYDFLSRTIGNLKSVFVTPNILTEASNLLESRNDRRYLDALKNVIQNSEEIVVSGVAAMRSGAFGRLGDAVSLKIVSEKRPLLTVDHDLSASAKEEGSAFNFTRYQSL